MKKAGITVVETQQYIARAEKILTEAENAKLIKAISDNPEIGDIIQGTGGIRKARFAIKGKGKSGGARVLHYYYNDKNPVYLITIFGKGERTNVTNKEKNIMYDLVQLLKKELKK